MGQCPKCIAHCFLIRSPNCPQYSFIKILPCMVSPVILISIGFSRKKGNSPLYLSFHLCWIATVLEGLFGEYHSSSAALGQQHPEVTKATTCT